MEVLQFAINMELEGERYYHEQAVKYADSALKVVFDLLAGDEAKHADILRSKMTGKAYTLKAQEKLTSQMGVFSGAAESSPEAGALPDQPELYKAAMQKEQQSIDLYEELRGKAADAQTEALFDFLIQEENKHFALLDAMFTLVNRPKEWVEAAEFGVREDY